MLKKQRQQSPKTKIRQALAEAQLMHKRLTWQDLREKTELSKGALSKHLNEMLKNGDIKPEIELSS